MWSDMDSDAPTRTKLARIMNVATTITVFLIRFSFRSSFLLVDSVSGCLVDRKWRGLPEPASVSGSTKTAAGRTMLDVVALTSVTPMSIMRLVAHTSDVIVVDVARISMPSSW